MRRAIDEAQHPKYAHIERERRWLVDASRRPDLSRLPHILIEDRYIIGTRMRLRRMTGSETGEEALKLTKKYEADYPLARPIVTAYLTPDEYNILAELPAKPITKCRFKIVEGATTFSLDRFEGALAGLELAEIEWPDDEGLRVIKSPLWTVREVSNDQRYQGGALAASGLPKD